MGLASLSGVIAMGCRLNDEQKIPSDVTPKQLSEHFRRDQYDAGFGSLAALNDAVPTRHVGEAIPPFLVLIAEAEKFQPPLLADAEAFKAKADRAGVGAKVTIVVLNRTRHLSALKNMAAGSSDPGLQAVIRFLEH
jgi:hypothetical protein